ncbi:fumarylacetoacetate hydrolase family protein [Nocardiopsis sp. RSe5-2]|uniref:Fumarylacetoacetate hydrolase family protein n=1 Tax=Nocardiopsis endophytica TaxID=3018445 RepID=A0ABT4TXZ5_9ACTN|nr:fumarylacetoacetate hydrolase family protein [Nocardiopsis endophytica]MDA2809558.1 fumarylacetoacetate hydrolase family protein [Nocardiopsis endophytica]
MRFMRLGEPGEEIPVVVDAEGRRLDLRPVTRDIDGRFLANGLPAAREDLESGALEPLEGAEAMRVGAPIARPTAVLCIGQNYAAHAAESDSPPPEVPILFFKHPNTVVGPYDDVAVPPGAERVDWEVELGVVIGRRARYLDSAQEALEHIAGYVTSNDVSEREYQTAHSGGQWSKGKCAETFNPVGPQLVTADEVDPQDLRLWSRVNGEPRQDSSTSDMIFTVAEIVRHLSRYTVLEPGDLINTGTPQGVALSGRFPYLRSGDVMEIGIDGLGEAQRQRLVGARL